MPTFFDYYSTPLIKIMANSITTFISPNHARIA